MYYSVKVSGKNKLKSKIIYWYTSDKSLFLVLRVLLALFIRQIHEIYKILAKLLFWSYLSQYIKLHFLLFKPQTRFEIVMLKKDLLTIGKWNYLWNKYKDKSPYVFSKLFRLGERLKWSRNKRYWRSTVSLILFRQKGLAYFHDFFPYFLN